MGLCESAARTNSKCLFYSAFRSIFFLLVLFSFLNSCAELQLNQAYTPPPKPVDPPKWATTKTKAWCAQYNLKYPDDLVKHSSIPILNMPLLMTLIVTFKKKPLKHYPI